MTIRPRPSERRSGSRTEGGSATVELVLLTPLLLLIAMVVVAFGRLAGARLDVGDAAHQAARAASIARTPTAAVAAARHTAAASLTGQRLTCAHLAVGVDTSSYRPGGTVAVTVTCTVTLGDLTLLHLPGATALSAGFVSPLDAFRGAGP